MNLPNQVPPVIRDSSQIRGSARGGLTPSDDPHCVGIGSLAQVCWLWDDSKQAVCFYAEIAGVRSGQTCVGQTTCTSQGFDVGFVKLLAHECVDFAKRQVCISGEACAFGQCATGNQCWSF